MTDFFANLPTVFFVITGLIISVFCFAYTTKRAFGKEFPWYVNLIGGVLSGPFIVLVALVCYVLDLLGAPDPIIK